MNFTVELPQIPQKEYNIKDFGAVNGGSVSNTKAINEAIIFTMGYVLDYRETKQTATKVNADDIPYFKNIMMKHITCNGAGIGLKIDGIDMESLAIEDKTPVIDNIVLEDSMIIAKAETKIEHAGEVRLNQVTFS